MAHEIVFAPEAQADLLKLYDDIANAGGAARAQAYTDRVIASCISLQNFAERGTRRDDLRPGLRTMGFRRRVTIAFHVTQATIIIDRVLYGGQDLQLALDDDDG